MILRPLTAILVFLVISFSINESGLPSGQPDHSKRGKGQKQAIVDARQDIFGSYKIISKKRSGEDISDFQIIKGNRKIFSDENYFDSMLPLRSLKEMPSPNCQSAITSFFSGGAHCCTTAILFTNCSDRENVFLIDLSHGSMEQVKYLDLKKDGTRQILVKDFSLAYYSPSDKLSLSFAASPAVTRLLNFDGIQLKPDNPNQFSKFYIDMLQEADRELKKLKNKSNNDEEAIVSHTISNTYYAIMAGMNQQQCENILESNLPGDWKNIMKKVYIDIEKAITSFNPVNDLN